MEGDRHRSCAVQYRERSGKRASLLHQEETQEVEMRQQLTALVVDDQLGSRESLRAILKPAYRVLVAMEGEQAVCIVRQELVDVVLLDLHLPGLSGIQVLEKIKTLDSSIGVIIVTGYASDETVLAGRRLGAFDYISKPFNVAYLRETVRRAVAHRSQRKEK
jgi:DNA-binding NtrC family response regulator